MENTTTMNKIEKLIHN